MTQRPGSPAPSPADLDLRSTGLPRARSQILCTSNPKVAWSPQAVCPAGATFDEEEEEGGCGGSWAPGIVRPGPRGPGHLARGTKAALDTLAPCGATVRTPRSSHGQQAHAETSPGRWAACWCPQERGLPGEHPCSGRGHSRVQAAATRVAVHVLPRVCGQCWWKGPTVHWDVTCLLLGPDPAQGRGALLRPDPMVSR